MPDTRKAPVRNLILRTIYRRTVGTRYEPAGRRVFVLIWRTLPEHLKDY